ncbi:hypothetical protein OIV83_006557, partial [Microbotryomycetes sp. JL201]
MQLPGIQATSAATRPVPGASPHPTASSRHKRPRAEDTSSASPSDFQFLFSSSSASLQDSSPHDPSPPDPSPHNPSPQDPSAQDSLAQDPSPQNPSPVPSAAAADLSPPQVSSNAVAPDHRAAHSAEPCAQRDAAPPELIQDN